MIFLKRGCAKPRRRSTFVAILPATPQGLGGEPRIGTRVALVYHIGTLRSRTGFVAGTVGTTAGPILLIDGHPFVMVEFPGGEVILCADDELALAPDA